MSWLVAWLNRLVAQPDKVLHAAVGAMLCAVVWILSGSWLLGVLAAHVAGWAKERYDKARPLVHTYDGWDAYATACGGLAFPVIYLGALWLFELQPPAWAAGLIG